MTHATRLLLVCAAIILPLGGCTMTGEDNHKPLPTLSAPYTEPFYVSVSDVVVESRYDPLANTKDVSSTFPTPPDMALKRYAETRLKPAGGVGVLRFIIDEASVFQEQMPSSNAAVRWLNMGQDDRYTVVIGLALIHDGAPSRVPGATMRMERTLTIAQSTSLAERDIALNQLMAKMLVDIDRTVADSLTHTLNLRAYDIAPSPGPWPVDPVDITPQGVNRAAP